MKMTESNKGWGVITIARQTPNYQSSVWQKGSAFHLFRAFFKRINFPSMSISSMQTFPVAEAEWEMLTLLLASDSSTSTLFRFPLVRTLRLRMRVILSRGKKGLERASIYMGEINTPIMKHICSSYLNAHALLKHSISDNLLDKANVHLNKKKLICATMPTINIVSKKLLSECFS